MTIKPSNIFAKINESSLANAPKRIDAVSGTYNMKCNGEEVKFTIHTKIDTLLNLLKNLIANKSCELTDKKESFEGIYGGDEKRCNYRVYDDSQQDKETLFAKFCDEALENSPYSEITYPELYAIWNKWVIEKNYTNICRNIGIGIGGKDSRAFIKYLKDFFKTSTNSATRGGQSIRIMMNVAKKGDSPTSPTKNSFVSDWT